MQRREFVRMTGGLTALCALPGACLAKEKRMKNALAHPEMYEQTPSEAIPGIWQTFVGSIACVQKTMGREVDPAWLMGVTGFAFRAIAQIEMTLSTVQWFHWETVCPEAIEQCGWQCTHVSHRGEAGSEEQRREAHREIVKAIDRGVPAIAWDIGDFEWGVLVGYDDERQSYDALACSNMVDWQPERSEYAKLSGCQRPRIWSHSRIGIMAPPHDRHNGASR